MSDNFYVMTVWRDDGPNDVRVGFSGDHSFIIQGDELYMLLAEAVALDIVETDGDRMTRVKLPA